MTQRFRDVFVVATVFVVSAGACTETPEPPQGSPESTASIGDSIEAVGTRAHAGGTTAPDVRPLPEMQREQMERPATREVAGDDAVCSTGYMRRDRECVPMTPEAAGDDSVRAERIAEVGLKELSLRDRITQEVERMPDLIARCKAMNPAVRLDTLEATQRGTDLVIHGAGRNVGDCALGGFKVRASAWGEIDGAGVRVDGQLTSIVELEEAFTFELYFYGTEKRGAPITVWFVLDDLADFVQENDRLVHSALGLNLVAPRIVLQ